MNISGSEATVWVANRERPLRDSFGKLNLTHDGSLVLTDQAGTSITINAEQSTVSSNTSLCLLDTGNLVLRAGKKVMWQSFDYPSDKWLPGMKLGWFSLNTKQPLSRFLTSFFSPDVPSRGGFTLGVDSNNTKQLVIWRREVVYWRSGPWNGHNFTHFPELPQIQFYNSAFDELSFDYFSDESQIYFTYTSKNDNLSSWIRIGSTGEIGIFEWSEGGPKSLINWSFCNVKYPKYRSRGCATTPDRPSTCKSGNTFSQTSGEMETWHYKKIRRVETDDCKGMCIRDCNCNAYALYINSFNWSGCKFGSGEKFGDGGETFYIRNGTVVEKVPALLIDTPPTSPRKSKLWLIIVGLAVSLPVLAALFLLCYLQCRNRNVAENNSRSNEQLMHELRSGLTTTEELSHANMLELREKKDHELPLMSFTSIEIATDFFSAANKIGQGGFGPVYKGRLVNGQEIAVKRLSKSSGQGLKEFKNEVVLISKLQHRNLVRLLGCCIQGGERILIYEYLPNKSLDSFLFDEAKRVLLDWKLRFSIIEGIAQGLLYLHKYSRLRIIHRDLKTSNILLDSDMNPKISDFGTARVFGENESQANTSRIIGTYGYMSPEYAMDGVFSIKSDVFSFGVMMLEILSGKRNIFFHHSNRSLNLLGYAWELWKEGQGLELMDKLLAETCSTSEFMRYVQIALLCVQESATDRPTMSEVLSMLSNEMLALPTPKQPAFSANVSADATTLPESSELFSVNNVTVSEVEAR